MQYENFKIFLIVGCFGLLIKINRFIYILLFLEILIVGIIVYNLLILTEINLIMILIFSVSSRVIGLTILVYSINQYGSEYVKF